MEPIVFFVFALISGIPAILFLLLGLGYFKNKVRRNTFLLLSLLCFAFPFLLMLFQWVNEKSEMYRLCDAYSATDSVGNRVILLVESNHTFALQSEKCDSVKIVGAWYYNNRDGKRLYFSTEYPYELNVSAIDDGSIYLKSDIQDDCFNLPEISFTRK